MTAPSDIADPQAAAPPPAGPRRRTVRLVLVLAVLLGVLSAVVRFGPGTTLGHVLLARALEGLRVGDLGWLHVEGVEGDPWREVRLARLTIADRHGPWLSARDVRLRWDGGALWRRRLLIHKLGVRELTLARQPVLLPPEPGPSGPLPVAVQVERFDARVRMTEQFAWRRGEYLLDGRLDLERRGAVRGALDAVSLGHAGDFLRLAFDFSHTAVTLEAHAREANGGALAGSLGLDPNQAFLLDARAHGSPRAGWFSLSSSVGASSPVRASGRWTPQGGEASGRLVLAASRWLAPWRAGIGDESAFRLAAVRHGRDLYGLDLAAGGAKAAMTAAGEVDPGRTRTGPKGLAVAVRVADLSALSGAPGLGPATLAGRLTGDPDRWRLEGQAAVEKVHGPGLAFARIAAPFQLVSDPKSLTLKAQASAAGGSGDTPLAVLLGPAPTAGGEIDFLPRGRMLLRRLQLRGKAIDAQGEGERSLFGGLSFKGQVRVHDLAAAAPGTRGLVTADWRAEQARETAPWSFSLQARGEGLHLGSPEADSILGPAPMLKAAGRIGPAGAVALERASLQGASVALTSSGTADPKGELRFSLDWTGKGPLTLGPMRSGGATSGSGTLSGTLGAPRLDLIGRFQTADLPGIADIGLHEVRLALSVAGQGTAASGRLGVDAATDDGPAHAGTDFRAEGADTALSAAEISVGGAQIKGSASLHGDRLTLADLTLAVGPGAFLARGQADGRLQVDGAGEAARAHLALSGKGIMFRDGSDHLDAVSLTADGPWRRLPYRLEVRGDAMGLRGRLAGSGAITQSDAGAAASFSGQGRAGKADFRTLEPAQVSFQDSGFNASLQLSVGQGGRADIALAQADGALKAHAVLAALDIGLIDPDVVGRLDGVLDLGRENGVMTGQAKAHVVGLVARDLPGAVPLAGEVQASLAPSAVALTTQLTDAHGSRTAMDLTLPATITAAPFAIAIETRRPISGHFTADGDIAPVWDLTQGGSQSLSGHVAASGVIGGTLADPRLSGHASLDNGAFEDSAIGLRLKDLSLKADMTGDAVQVAALSASDGEKGQVSGSGRISLLRAGGSSFKVALTGFRLIDNAQGQASASGDLSVDRAADGKVRLAGALNIDRAQISPTASAPSGVVSMEVIEIHQPVEQAPFVSQPAGHDAPIALDIALRAPGGVFIKGRGLNLELSLDARVGGTTDGPSLTGVARVVRGDYDFAGKRFRMDDTSVVRLGATPETIRLDLSATREDPNLTAVVKIQGTAARPTLTLTSTPELPKDEVLSQVLFGSSAAQLSGLQAAQLASAMAGLAGKGGFDVIGGLRNFAHLDRLAIESTALTGFSVAGGKYVTDRVYVELSDSAKTGQGAQVEWRVKKHLAIVSRVTSQGDHALSVRWRRDY